ncbi:MAG TPA: hypothetical protein VKV06_07205 [Acidimicrobiales bacterium]|nr:hypothetical protein [Acidimicrobiales bacterium]
MADGRWVLLGLAHPRAAWFAEVARWSTSATIAAEFVKCVSSEEVRARLASGRAYSALLVDASLASFDRDLVAAAATSYTPVIAITDGRGPAWSPGELGVAAVLPAAFDREQLVDVLTASAHPIARGDELPPLLAAVSAPAAWRGRLVAVCGPGGTGASTTAIATAQGLGTDARYGGRVLLADLALRADQAMLHDAGDLGPGVQELVEAHRLGRPDLAEIGSYTFDVPRRGYRLLLGLRRPSAWAALRPRATEAAVASLRQAFQLVVADVTGDVEGEAEGGSLDVEERNHLARCCVLQADLVLVVGSPGFKGIHTLASTLRALVDAGVDQGGLVAVLNRAPRSPRARSEIAQAVAHLAPAIALTTPVWIPERPLEPALRDGTPLPAPVVQPLTAAVRSLLERRPAQLGAEVGGPTLIEPGSLGSLGAWGAEESD